MLFRRIGHKILGVVGIAVTVGLVATASFYTRHQEKAVLAQNERTMLKLAESVSQGLQSVMLAGYADVAQEFAGRLKKVPEIEDFSILRVDGREAFRDNLTIQAVNQRLGSEAFARRDRETTAQVLAPDDAVLQQAILTRHAVSYYAKGKKDERFLTFLAPILNNEACQKCHGEAHAVRGVLKLTTSLAPVERDILKARQESLLVLGIALMGTLLLTGYMIGRSIVKPIAKVTDAMVRASGGDLQQVPVDGQDELSQMAGSFNHMTNELQKTYQGLRHEQDKLTTIIHSAREAIVVTDADGRVVLVNPAAERLLGKSSKQITAEGFLALLDDPALMERLLANKGTESASDTVGYNGHIFNLYVSTIYDGVGEPVGSAALLRDITEEKRLENELRQLSRTDPLTGLFNRRHLDETLERELARTRRYQHPVSILMLDIDHFKRFNDEHGHETGDRVLCAVAERLQRALRTNDVPCRYGGEEFLAILPDTAIASAGVVAERVRRDVEAMEINGLKVSVSIGIAAYPDVAAEGRDALVEAADRALYEAKRGGRNRVCAAEHAAAT